ATTTAILALGDALAMAVSHLKGFSATDFRKSHPGGQLGRQMMPITEALRFKAGVNLPLVSEMVTVESMLQQAAQTPRRAGAVLLVDEQGKLSGIFTDADLRRLLLRDGTGVLQQGIRSVMTRNPMALSDSAVVRDAVQMIREKRLDEIPVVDASGKPVGLIDVQDLIALKVIQE
ncbi:MAG: CBS domain-containing protein, partial [Phycisphaerales bacterium]|nr:CBS domain-containing protein [Phycisphaerales bacterium]